MFVFVKQMIRSRKPREVFDQCLFIPECGLLKFYQCTFDLVILAESLPCIVKIKQETVVGLLVNYRGGVAKLLDFLAERADLALTEIVKADLLAYRDHLAATLTARTANNHLALLRMLFKGARRDEVVTLDPAEFVGSIRERRTFNKRPFSLAEIQAVLSVADTEWRSLVIFGLYTGQRLSDLAVLSWSNIDLERGEVRLVRTAFSN